MGEAGSPWLCPQLASGGGGWQCHGNHCVGGWVGDALWTWLKALWRETPRGPQLQADGSVIRDCDPERDPRQTPGSGWGLMEDPLASEEPSEKDEEPEATISLKSCISQGLKELHETPELCNATLLAGGKKFPCNRALLASVSPYFEAVFTSGFKESRDGEVLLKDMDPALLQNLLAYLYSGELELNMETAEEMFTAASRLQFMPALALISKYLTEKITMENCLRLHMLARDHNNPILLRATLRYLCLHFGPLSDHEDFPHLDLSTLSCIICSDHLAVNSEMAVYQAVQRWMLTKPAERLPAFKTLLRHLRFPLLTPKEVAQIQADAENLGQPVELRWEQLDGAGRLRVSGGLRRGMYHEKIICIKVPRLRDILSVNEDMDSYIECLNPATGSRTKLPPLELVALPGCSVLDYKLYISGGKHPNGTYSRALHEYNALTNLWTQLPSMSTARSVHMFLTCKQRLFALSGWNDTGPLASAESFDVAQQIWSPIASLPVILRFSASVSFKHKLYLIGGDADSDEVVYRGILIYDTILNSWAQLPLQFSLHGAAAVAMETGICILGGFFSRKIVYPNRRFSQLLPCTAKCFFMHESGVVSKEPTVPPLPLPLAFAGATRWRGKVYVMGGVCTSRTHDAIYHWEPGEAAWTQYPEYLTGQGTIVRRVLKCVTLKVARPHMRVLVQEATTNQVAVGLSDAEVPSKGQGKENPIAIPPDPLSLALLEVGDTTRAEGPTRREEIFSSEPL